MRVPAMLRTEGHISTGRFIVLYVLVFVLHRGMLLALGFDGVFYWEETYRLIVAESLLKGWSIPWTDLQADPYSGGSLVMAALAMPVVGVFGESVMALKWVALSWNAVGMACWLLLVDRYFGRKTAWFFGWAFLCAPPLFITYNLITMGSHAELVTLIGIQYLLAFRYIYGARRSVPCLLAWTAFAGASIWFGYVSSLALAGLLTIALATGALPVRRWPIAALGLGIGLTPWIVYNIVTAGSGLHVVVSTFSGTGPGQSGVAAYTVKLAHLLVTGLPAGLGYHDVRRPLAALGVEVSRYVFAYPYFIGVAAAWVACVWRTGVGSALLRPSQLRACVSTHRELAILLLLPIFVAVIAASNQIFDERINRLSRVPFLTYRVLVPAFPAAFFAGALAASRLSPRWYRLAVLAVAGLGAIASAQVAVSGAQERPRIEREARALGANAAGQLLYYKHGVDMSLIAARIAALGEDLRAPAYRGVGFSLAYHQPASAPVADLLEDIRGADPRYRRDVLDGARLAVGRGMEQVAPLADSPRTQAVRAALDALALQWSSPE
jgi:hypothetical protein